MAGWGAGAVALDGELNAGILLADAGCEGASGIEITILAAFLKRRAEIVQQRRAEVGAAAAELVSGAHGGRKIVIAKRLVDFVEAFRG